MKPETNNSERSLESHLHSQKKAAIQDARTVIDGKLGDMASQLTKGEHVLAPINALKGDGLVVRHNPVLAIFIQKAEELTKEFEKLKGQAEDSYLLARQNIIFASWQSRLNLALELGDEGASLLHSINIPEVMAHYLDGRSQEIYLKKIEEEGKTLVPDITEALVHFQEGKITPKDWEIVKANLRNLSISGKNWVEVSTAMTIVRAIPPHFRPDLLRQIQNQADYATMVLKLLAVNYISVAQAEMVIEEQIKAKKGKREDTNALEALLAKVQDKTMVEQQEKVEAAQRLAEKRAKNDAQVGHTNSMRQLLSFEGIAGSILAVNGMVTVLANVLMNLSPDEWENLPDNPAVWMGLGMAGVGGEVSKGFGGLTDTPSTNIAQLLKGKSESKDKIRQMRDEAFEKKVLRYPTVAELYFQGTENINAAYQKKRLKSNATEGSFVSLSIEEMGFNWEALPEKYKKLGKEEAAQLLSEWVARMVDDKHSVETQKLMMGGDANSAEGVKMDFRGKYGLPPLEEWNKELKAKYLNENK